jgi:hypothetical protein
MRAPDGPLPPEAKQKVAELEKRIQQMPANKQAAFNFMVGARLAELEPTQPEFAKYVRTFRQEAERRATSSLKPPRKEDLGRPKVYGAGDVTKAALNSIKDVEQIQVKGQRYNKTWSGGSLILVPQPKDAPPPNVKDSPINKLGLHPDVHKSIREASPHKVIIIKSPIGK